MKKIETVIFVEPTPKGRTRSAVVQGQIRNYTPAKTLETESLLKALIRQQVMEHGSFDKDVPLCLSATFYIDRPKSLQKRITKPIKRPDVDNYSKLLLDALNKYVFPDDSQIVTMKIRKRFSSPPRIELLIVEELD